jgi:hypothetical protein
VLCFGGDDCMRGRGKCKGSVGLCLMILFCRLMFQINGSGSLILLGVTLFVAFIGS